MKVEGLVNWPRGLQTIKQVWSTLGVLGYQRPFIPGFTHIAQPLTNLLKKGTTFTWTVTTLQGRLVTSLDEALEQSSGMTLSRVDLVLSVLYEKCSATQGDSLVA